LTRFLDSRQIFSGLNSKYLPFALKEINFLVKIGNYSYGDIMNMPVYIRRFMLGNLQEALTPKNSDD
jgi:hypothetical protein